MTSKSEELRCAQELDEPARHLHLTALCVAWAKEYRRTQSSSTAYLIASALYDTSPEGRARATRVKGWLHRALYRNGDAPTVRAFATMLLACVCIDEADWHRSRELLASLPADGFRRLDSAWAWRDLRVSDLLMVCAVRLGQVEADAVHRLVSRLEEADRDDVPAPHELLAALEAFPARVADVSALLRFHAGFGWPSDLGTAIDAWVSRIPTNSHNLA